MNSEATLSEAMYFIEETRSIQLTVMNDAMFPHLSITHGAQIRAPNLPSKLRETWLSIVTLTHYANIRGEALRDARNKCQEH
ncbi:hypothetical protein WN944_015477 [Citrus x changshan-huyou]|uniref:Uncharacterized protein n=1 Tax=Citrus x changshan-huyou TaxID=2935761 RepID=A0AAP0ME37_9ROSI